MKIAICFSGHLRDFLKDAESILFKRNVEYLKNQNHTVDLFFSIWDTYNTKTNIHGGEEIDIDESVLLDLNITTLEIENYASIKNQFKLKNFHSSIEPEKANLISEDGILHNTPMFYKIYRANYLKSQYEEKHNFVYDVVVRYRANIYPHKIFDFSDVKSEFLYIDGYGFMGKPKPRGLNISGDSYMLQDIFFYGDSITMNVVCDVYRNLSKLYPKYGTTGPERIFYDWVILENRIKTKHHSIGFSIK